MAAAHPSWDCDVRDHLLRTAELSFGAIQDPDAAVDAAVGIVQLMLEHVPADQRLAAGAALVRKAVQ